MTHDDHLRAWVEAVQRRPGRGHGLRRSGQHRNRHARDGRRRRAERGGQAPTGLGPGDEGIAVTGAADADGHPITHGQMSGSPARVASGTPVAGDQTSAAHATSAGASHGAPHREPAR